MCTGGKIAGLGGLILAIAMTPTLEATTITVTSLDDNFIPNPVLTLREAIFATENDTSVDGSAVASGADVIVFDPALFAAGPATINLTQFEPGLSTNAFGPSAFAISNTLTIVGPTGSNGLTISRSGNQDFRLFHVRPAGNLTISNVTLSGGTAQGGHGGSGNGGGGGAAGMGGAFYNQGILELSHCTVMDNEAIGGDGREGSSGGFGGGGGGVGEDGESGSDPNGGDPNGGDGEPKDGDPGGPGGGGGGGDERSAAGSGSSGSGGNGGFAGGGGGAGYCQSTGGGTPSATAGDGADGGLGGGGGTAFSFNGPEFPGSGGAGGRFGGAGTGGTTIQNAAGGDGGGAAGLGGAIFNNAGTVSMLNCTLTENEARGGNSGDGEGGDAHGGAIFNYNGQLTMIHCTASGNRAVPGTGSSGSVFAFGGAVFTLGEGDSAHVHLDNSILANSIGVHDYFRTAADGGTPTDSGIGNLIESETTFTGSAINNTDPKLNPRADYGGPTETFAPKSSSVAIDGGQDAVAAGTFDQRGSGFPRILDGDLDGNATVDIGAYEVRLVDYGDAPGPSSRILECDTNNLRISVMGNDAETNILARPDYQAFLPAVTYNASNHEFLVVWHGTTDIEPPMVFKENEIFGVRIDAATGALLGSQFRISFMGTEAETNAAQRQRFGGFAPAVAWNSGDNQYLVVWYGDDDSATLVDGEFEIFGQRLTATGALLGGRIRISQMGPNGDIEYDALTPDVAFSALDNEYMVVWHGDDDSGTLINNEDEVFAQRVTAAGALGGGPVRVSTQGSEAAPPLEKDDIDARKPKLAYNIQNNRYLVVWEGDSDLPPMTNDEIEIFGQLLTVGGLLGANFRISEMGPDGDPLRDARNSDVAYDSVNNRFLVVWDGDDDSGALADNEYEIYGEIVDSLGAEIIAQFRLSDMGVDGDTSRRANKAGVAFNPDQCTFLVVWHGDDATDGKNNIYGQSVDCAGNERGENDFLIGSGGGETDDDFDQDSAALAYCPAEGLYLVAWEGEDDGVVPLTTNEIEILARRFKEIVIFDYDTRISDDGPSHVGRIGLRIGNTLDGEIDGQPSTAADGDDTFDVDDEDGIANAADCLVFPPGQGAGIHVSVQNTTGDDATLYGWIDLNGDGAFDNHSERASAPVPAGTVGLVRLDFGDIPAGATPITFARFRLSTDSTAANETGAARDGEVEDYPVSLAPVPGDADMDGMNDNWEIANFGSTGFSDGTNDIDGDTFIDRDEFWAGTDPNNSTSKLAFTSIALDAADAYELTWQGVTQKLYSVYYKSNALDAAWQVGLTGIAGSMPLNVVTANVAHKNAVFKLLQK